MAERIATVIVSPAFAKNDHARLHAATPHKFGGFILACNGRWLEYGDTYAPDALDRSKAFACQRCVKGIASGRIKLEVAS